MMVRASLFSRQPSGAVCSGFRLPAASRRRSRFATGQPERRPIVIRIFFPMAEISSTAFGGVATTGRLTSAALIPSRRSRPDRKRAHPYSETIRPFATRLRHPNTPKGIYCSRERTAWWLGSSMQTDWKRPANRSRSRAAFTPTRRMHVQVIFRCHGPESWPIARAWARGGIRLFGLIDPASASTRLASPVHILPFLFRPTRRRSLFPAWMTTATFGFTIWNARLHRGLRSIRAWTLVILGRPTAGIWSSAHRETVLSTFT